MNKLYNKETDIIKGLNDFFTKLIGIFLNLKPKLIQILKS